MTLTLDQRPEQTELASPVSPALRYQLQAETPAGRQLVAIAESLAEDLAARAAEHDRDASYPFEAIGRLKSLGYFGAQVPTELGGLGVSSVRDTLIASSRMARGDASVVIGVNMHLAITGNLVRRYQMAVATGNERRAAAFAGALEMITRSGVVIAAAVSEPGQDLLRPSTRAERTPEGWVINGRKIFATMSPAADLLFVAVTAGQEDGSETYTYARIPTSTPGIVFHDDWDALGMRASGSQSLSFENVRVAAEMVRGGFPVGDPAGYLEANLTAGAFHASASLGIAEGAHHLATSTLATRRKNGSEPPVNLMLTSQNANDIAAMRGIFDRAGRIIDSYYAAHPVDDGTPEELAAAFAEVQSAKAFINEASVRVVDRALTLSGGAGFTNKHPLSRHYRDVRAGAFMHPLGANRAPEFIGQVAAGLEPTLR